MRAFPTHVFLPFSKPGINAPNSPGGTWGRQEGAIPRRVCCRGLFLRTRPLAITGPILAWPLICCVRETSSQLNLVSPNPVFLSGLHCLGVNYSASGFLRLAPSALRDSRHSFHCKLFSAHIICTTQETCSTCVHICTSGISRESHLLVPELRAALW